MSKTPSFTFPRRASLRDCDLCDEIQRGTRKVWDRDKLELRLAVALNDLADCRKKLTTPESHALANTKKMLRRAGLLPSTDRGST